MTNVQKAIAEGKRCAREGTSESAAEWAASVAYKTEAERASFMAAYRREDQNAGYRAAMIDSGRGRLLR